MIVVDRVVPVAVRRGALLAALDGWKATRYQLPSVLADERVQIA
jgi:hypothetical protein